MIAKDPWKGSKVNSVLYINNPMPRIESQKENMSQKSPKKKYVSKQSTKPNGYKIAKVLHP